MILDPELIARLNDAFEGHVRLIQTVPFNVHSGDNAGFSAALARTLTTPGLWAVLVDAARRGKSGGLGMAFDWELAAQEIRLACNTATAASGCRSAAADRSRRPALPQRRCSDRCARALGRRCGQRSRGRAGPQRPAAVAQLYLRGARLASRSGEASVEIRDAALSDIAQITEIYNSIVLTSTAIYNDRCVTAEERAGWWVRRVGARLPGHRRGRGTVGPWLWLVWRVPVMARLPLHGRSHRTYPRRRREDRASARCC